MSEKLTFKKNKINFENYLKNYYIIIIIILNISYLKKQLLTDPKIMSTMLILNKNIKQKCLPQMHF